MQDFTKVIDFNRQCINLLNQQYQKLDTEFAGIPAHQQPILKNLGQKKIVYSLHGFIGTPFEMAYLDNRLERSGFAIYHDIIPGFSATAKVANLYCWKQWQQDLEFKTQFLLDQYEEIYLMGFSTGGLLLHHFLLNHVTDLNTLKKIKSVVLYSPFYQPYYGFGPKLNKFVSKFMQEVPIKSLYRLTHVADMKVMILQPQNYLMKVPLKTAGQVEDLGAVIQNSRSTTRINVPVLCFLSDADRVAKVKVSESVIRRDFIEPEFVFFKDERVPHHLMVPDVNHKFGEVEKQVAKFLRFENE